MILIGVLSVAFAVGQNSYKVFRGAVREYKINKTAFAVNYSWQVFTDIGYTVPANPSQVELKTLGAGRENEIQVKWNSAGDYYLMVSVYTDAGCSNRMAWHFAVDAVDDMPTARISGAPYRVVGNCGTTGIELDASASGGDGLAYSWSPTAFLDNPSASKTRFIPGVTTRYLLTVIDSKGQQDTASVLIVVANAPKAVTDKNVFVDVPNRDILLNGAQSTGAGLSYLWQSKDGIIQNGETTPTAQVSGLGMYYLLVTDSLGCQDKDSVNVGLYIQAINDTANTMVNESVIINVLRNDTPGKAIKPSSISIVTPPMHGIAQVDADSLIFYNPDQYYTGQDEFIYAVCDYFQNCDQAKVLVFINDLPFFIPEAFSPNGDGINDKFEIKGLAKHKTVELEIFNRWGNVVYRSANYGEGNGKGGFWDGTAQTGVRIGSGPVPSGTYFYILKLDGKENINGSIYLDR